ncbi:hypothetical protein [Streptomyces prunicolor]|uniref:hypothetical protein n=1 Tax=Streptomyces prunicolor TaxID=67348 RepID=UPI0033D5AC84
MPESITKVSIPIDIDLAELTRVPDDRLLMMWHAAQFNPAPYGDWAAGEVVQKIGSEIIRRWIAATAPALYHHQGRDHYWHHLTRFAVHRDGDWQPDPAKRAAYYANNGIQSDATNEAKCPRNVIDDDYGDHFFKRGALSDSPIACVYCGAKKAQESAGGEC